MKNRKKDYPLYEISAVRDFKQSIEEAIDHNCKGKPAYRYKQGKEFVDDRYEQFYDDTRAFGTALVELGCRKSHVAMIGPNSYKWIVGCVSVLNGDGVFAPIDKELPIEDMVRLLNYGDVDTVIYAPLYEERLKAVKEQLPNICHYINLDAKEDTEDHLSFDKLLEHGKELLAAGNTEYIDIEPDVEAMKLLVFTSGTTGNPKGVMLSTKNIISISNEGTRISSFYDVGLSILPYHHTYELVCHILVAYKYGSTVCINESLRSILTNFKLYQPTHTFLVPLFLEKFYKTIWQKAEEEGKADTLRKSIKISNALLKTGIDMRSTLFKDVRAAFGGKLIKIVCGGAPLRAEVAEFFEAIGIKIMNGYGITECSPLVAGNRDYYYNFTSVGSIVPCIDVKIENPNEDGEGEICVKGDTVMMGYYKMPEQTAAVMDEDGYFHTGDYGKMGEDNRLYITGRKKNMIVLKNGKNIYPEELEDALMGIEGIAEVIVSAVTDESGSEIALSAEIYPDEKQYEGKTDEEIYAAIKALIEGFNDNRPVYKKITKVVIRKTPFDKTTSGKIKRTYAK